MKNSTTLESTKTDLTAASESFERITKEANRAAVDLVKAKENLKIKKVDDGNTDPSEQYEESKQAKKNVFIKNADAKRAAKNLKESEVEFEAVITKAVPILSGALMKKREKVIEQLKEELRTRFGLENPPAEHALNQFVCTFPKVMELDSAVEAINRGPFAGEEFPARRMLKALMAAGALV